MNVLKTMAIAALATLGLAACSTDDDEPMATETAGQESNGKGDEESPRVPEKLTGVIQLNDAERALSDKASEFALDLFAEFDKTAGTHDNLAISPFSAQIALSMLANGAACPTRESVLAALRWSGHDVDELNDFNKRLLEEMPALDEDEADLAFANGLWAAPSFGVKSGLKEKLNEVYDAEAAVAGRVELPQVLNQWCADKTRGMVDRIIDRAPEDYKMVLANALYFKSSWNCGFNPKSTQPDTFTNTDGTMCEAEYMHSSRMPGFHAESEKFTLAEIPFKNLCFNLTIIVPRAGVGMAECVKELKARGLNNVYKTLKAGPLKLKMPKFEAKTAALLERPLVAMGGGGMFADNADYSLISDQAMSVSSVLQAAHVRVDEDGAEGSAVTVVMGGDVANHGDEPAPFEFTADRTFLYIIREGGSGAVLFIGRVGY